MKGTFISIWNDGIEISTPAELNTETGELIIESVNVDGLDLDILINEKFIDENDDKYEVCPDCHCFIMRTVMSDGIGHTLNEIKVCSDPYCESNL